MEGEAIPEGTEIYVSREELLAENPVNPKIWGGLEVEFLVAKAEYGKFVAAEVRRPGGRAGGACIHQGKRSQTHKARAT